VRHSSKLALCDAFFEIVAPEDIIEIFHAIDFVNAFIGADEQPDMIPFTGRLCGIKRFASVWIGRGLV
jgi:hypothetical protein